MTEPAPTLSLVNGDPVAALRPKLERFNRRMAREGVTPEPVLRYGGGRWVTIMGAHVLGWHRERDYERCRDNDQPEVSDFDDRDRVFEFCDWWDLLAGRRQLLVSVLYLHNLPGVVRSAPAAYFAAKMDGHVCRVFDSRMVAPTGDTRFYWPGGWLEMWMVDQLRRLGFRSVDWMSSEFPHALLASDGPAGNGHADG